jgi:capsular exopolysaccharide synthesis family protein
VEPIDYLRIIRRRWAVVAACLVVALVAAWVTTPAQSQMGKPVTSYTATATLLQPPGNKNSLDYIGLFVTKGDVPIAAAKKLGFDSDPALLASQVQVSADGKVGSLTITSQGTDGDQAAKVANTFAEEIIAFLRRQQQEVASAEISELEKQMSAAAEKVEELNQQLKGSPDDSLLKAQRDAQSARYGTAYSQLQQALERSGGDPKLSVLQAATPIPVVSGGFTPPSSHKGRLTIGGMVGLILGCVLALVLERIDTKLRTRAAVQEAFGVPVVADVPHVPRGLRTKRSTVVVTAPGSEAAEAYRTLRSAITFLESRPIAHSREADTEPDARHQSSSRWTPNVILVASARAGEGKTTTVANLAACFAEAGRRVLVLDCDFRKPEVNLYLDVPNGPGLSDLLASTDNADLMTLSRPTVVPAVRLVTGGTALEQPAALPTRMTRLIAEARDLADVVLIDTAPILLANDAIDLMPYVDTVLLAAKSGRTVNEQAERVHELLARMRVPVSGVTFIGAAGGSPWTARIFGRGQARGSRGWYRQLREKSHERQPL